MKLRGFHWKYVSALLLCAILVASAPRFWANASSSQILPAQGAASTASAPVTLSVDPDHSALHWMLDTTLHTVHGTFKYQRGTLQIDPATGKASGEIVVSATSGDSGNEGRDKKMHKDVLESSRYQEIVFRPDRIEGTISPQGTSHVQVHGIFALHGAEHELTVPVDAELTADHWKGNSKFIVPFIQWGLKNPSNFLLKVKHEVAIELELTGSRK